MYVCISSITTALGPVIIVVATRRFRSQITVRAHDNFPSKYFQFSTRRTRILMGFHIYHLVLIVNPMGRILVRWKSSRNNLEMLCHPICNWLYVHIFINIYNVYGYVYVYV